MNLYEKTVIRRSILKKMREATIKDMDVVYMMGFDVWGDKMPTQDYLTMCQGSSKYKKGKWFVLEDTDTKELLSSLIVYELKLSEDLVGRGIGSISTPLHVRRKGYASILLEKVINELEQKMGCNHFFLYSDIGSDFYKRFNFVEIPPSMQKYKDSICMYYSKENDMDAISFDIPDYF